jgi:hypothetical protein
MRRAAANDNRTPSKWIETVCIRALDALDRKHQREEPR